VSLDYVSNNPQAFKNAYFDINWVKVYEKAWPGPLLVQDEDYEQPTISAFTDSMLT